MPVQNPKDLFVQILSDLRQSTERSTKFYQELGQAAGDTDLKEAMEARAFVAEKDLATLDDAFKMIGQKPVKSTSRFQETLIEDFRKELAEIQNPKAKALFILMKANHLTHFRLAEYGVLVGAADLSGHYGVGALLESAMSDKLAFVERNRRFIRNRFEQRVAERMAA
jgi:ferritin-like metal-binding protein YciE